jgi:hypothetical protein
MEDNLALRWRKSTYSGNGGTSCVEVGQDAGGTILVRDTKDSGTGPLHRYPRAEWRAFLADVRAGEPGPDGSGRVP